jgi:REP element-mobilizing transposase RayT
MGQSLVKNYIHIVFSTKNREPLILRKYEAELYSYVAGICSNYECQPIKIGGYYDHVHVLCMLSKKVALMNFVKEIKRESSLWMKTKDESLIHFYWQDGYGGFSVSPNDVEKVSTYITNQHEHRSRHTFQDEYRKILKKYKVEYDERYVWD